MVINGQSRMAANAPLRTFIPRLWVHSLPRIRGARYDVFNVSAQPSSQSALTRPCFTALTRAECIHYEWYHRAYLYVCFFSFWRPSAFSPN